MHTLWFFIVSLLMFSASNRHPDLTCTLCARSLRLFRPPLVTLPNSIPIWSSLLPSFNSLLVAFICRSRKVPAIHRRPTELDFKAVSLLLLAGDVALNPGPITPLHDLRIGSIDVRSVREKGPILHDLIVSKSLDILAVTETWLRANDTSAFLSDLTPPGFSFLHVPRHGRPGDGVGLYF